MSASKALIASWLADAYRRTEVTHLVVKCDTFGPDCCYPVFVTAGQHVPDVVYNEKDRTIEVYDMSLNLDAQLHEHRAWHMPQVES